MTSVVALNESSHVPLGAVC